MGYYDCVTPSVILRNVFENPGWYTPYTPYQAEIAQGRLESLLNFQTVVKDLTGMDIATASLLDEGTAAAEAMTMFHRLQTKKAPAGQESVFLVSDRCFPQTIDVLRGRAEPLDIRLEIGDPSSCSMEHAFGVLLQYPDDRGAIADLRPIDRQGPRGRPARRGGERSDGADAHHASRRDGRRRRRRQLAAVRRAARVRRTARGVLRDAGGVRPPGAGANHRPVGGRARTPGVPHGAPDPRAAHPPREGDVEHLHRAGAAGEHRGDVRGLSRTGRAEGDRRPASTRPPARSRRD